METPPKSPSPNSPLPFSNGVSWRSLWVQRLYWLISALSGTLEIEQRMKEREQRTREYEQRMRDLRKENDRLAKLESKLDGLFSKHSMNSKTPQKPDQP